MKGGIYMIIFFDKKWLIYVICVSLMLVNFSGGETFFAEENLAMYSQSYALTDASTGRVLAGKNETTPMANASTTKILTCIITLENCSLNEVVTISANASSQPKVRLGMGEGEQYPLVDMLYGLMLESYNDCAVAIAEHVAGSVEDFSEMMNDKAKEIGCVDTYFITPNGLDSEVGNQFHHTTASDLCNIMAYCVWESPMKDVFLQITQTRNYSGAANGNTYSFVNRNAFLDQMDGVLSGKTGYTAKAGYCYVAAYEKSGEKYCIALLACGWPNNKTYKWSDTRTLLNYAINNYDIKTVKVNTITETLEIDGYINEPEFVFLNQKSMLGVSGEMKSYEVLLGENETVRKEIVLYTDTTLPIKEGQVLGECNIYVEDMLLDTIFLTAKSNSDIWKLEEIMKVVLHKFLTFSS